MYKRFIWINGEKKHMNDFTIGYMINPGLNVNKTFRQQVGNFMYTTFGEITQPFIKTTLSTNNASVLELIIFNEIRGYKKAH